MRINKKQKRAAYTLAEIMVVILLLTIIFAAFAPIITKRMAKERSTEVWTSAGAPDFDAYTDSSNGQNGAMFIGVNPATMMDVYSDAFMPLSKLVVRSGRISSSDKQAQIQFRHGNGANKDFIANWLVDPNGNFLLGGDYRNLIPTMPTSGEENALVTEGRPYNNTALGYGAFNSMSHVAADSSITIYAPGGESTTFTNYKNAVNKNVALGHNAMMGASGSINNVAVGSGAGQHLDYKYVFNITALNDSGLNNTFVGYRAGYKVLPHVTTTAAFGTTHSTLDGRADNNVAIGYQAFGNTLDDSRGYNNTYVGAYAGFSNSASDAHKSLIGHNNVGIGYQAMYGYGNTVNVTSPRLTWYQLTGNDNVAIGAFALKNITTGSYNVAIGYNACSEITSGSYKTCIGYNSGPHNGTRGIFHNDGEAHDVRYVHVNPSNLRFKGPNVDYAYIDGRVDQVQRTYIGSQPKEGFGGDAVLEIHNPTPETTGIKSLVSGATKSNATTIVNGNLIVRGRPYFTVGSTLYHFNTFAAGSSADDMIYYGANGNHASLPYTLSDGKYPVGTYTSMGGAVTQYPILFKSSSDRRLKDIGTRFTAGLEELRNIKVYNYNFKADKDKKPQVGVIAQELQKVFPTAVFKGEDGYLKIRWDELFYAVLNGIKEIDKRVAELSKRIVNFDSKISKLEKQNTELKTQVNDLAVRVNKLKAQ